MSVELRTTRDVQELFDRCAARRPESIGAALSAIGVDGLAFKQWNALDVIDTLAVIFGRAPRPDAPMAVSTQDLAAAITIHVQLAFEAGFEWARERGAA